MLRAVVALVAIVAAASIGRPDDSVRFLRQFGGHGSEPGQFNAPIDVVVNAADEVLVSDFYNARVQKFDREGKLLAVMPVGYNPGGMALDADSSLYLGHFGFGMTGEERKADKVTVHDPTGQQLREWGKSGSGDGEFDMPGGIAISADGTVYVADQTNRRVQAFTREGTFLLKWGEYGVGPGQFGGNVTPKSRVGGPQFLAIDAEGNVYTTEGSVGRIQKFTADGQYLSSWGDNEAKPGSFGGQFRGFEAPSIKGPVAIRFDRHGLLWITAVCGRVQQFTADGKLLRGFGEEQGTEPGQFFAPHGLAFNSHGELYVVDGYNHRVQMFAVGE